MQSIHPVQILSFLLIFLTLAGESQSAELTHGPLVGHVAPEEARIWARGSVDGDYEVRLNEGDEPRVVATRTASTNKDADCTFTWHITGLTPGRRYRYEIFVGKNRLTENSDQRFVTPREPSEEMSVKLAFGSCAWDVSHPRQPVWTAIQQAGADAVVLLGDTPYIDSTELAVLRQRYRDFWSNAELKPLMRTTPIYAVWDDHDFGPDNALGLIPGKENSRRAFLEYHANPSYGLKDAGIFTKFRRGPIEIFLLDTRWFANTEDSPVNPERKTLIGRMQWDWLRENLRASTAPFKLLACGMIWNEAVYPGKLDCWMAYPYEREALFQFLKQAGITGVVLIGGDIHRSRHLIHPTKARVGYDLHELITSPLAENPAPDNNIPSPYLQYDAELHHSFLLIQTRMEEGKPVLQADFHSRDESKYQMKLRVEK